LVDPYGVNLIVVTGPTHFTGLCGGVEATKLPVEFQAIVQALAVILTGGKFESNIGLGRLPGFVLTNFREVVSMA